MLGRSFGPSITRFHATNDFREVKRIGVIPYNDSSVDLPVSYACRFEPPLDPKMVRKPAKSLHKSPLLDRFEVGILFAIVSFYALVARPLGIHSGANLIALAACIGCIRAFSRIDLRKSLNSVVNSLTADTGHAEQLADHVKVMTIIEQVADLGSWSYHTGSGRLLLSDGARKICGNAKTDQNGLDVFLNAMKKSEALRLEDQISKQLQFSPQSDLPLGFKLTTEMRVNGSWRHIDLTTFRDYDRGDLLLRGVIRDDTDSIAIQKGLRDQASKLNELATYDPLTGLENRHSFHNRLEEDIERSRISDQKLVLLLIDLDGFKEINDTMGHQSGDVALREISHRLRSIVRGGDVVARLGGDEFTMILNNVKEGLEVQLLAGRLIRAIRQPIEIGGKTVRLGASVGAASYPMHTTRSEELLSFADTAMYVAKRAGTGIEVYEPSMTSEITVRRDMESELRKAWENGEFELFYQPLMNETGVSGVEALLRWRKDGELVSPIKFIPHLERNGDIVKVGRWVIRQACLQGKRWMDSGIDTKVSVNISARQFHDPDFVDSVWDALHEAGLPDASLDLELTESLLIDDVDKTANKLNLLKETGVRISIDDFGTGYSSLAYLRHLPLDRLKIDRTFVKDINNGDDGTIASSIILLAHSLGLEVVAEGVETAGQLEFLRDRGCDEYQGYFFSRPLDADSCTAFLRQQTKKGLTIG